MEWTDNPVRDAERYAAMQEENANKLHCCVNCGKIFDDYAYEINGHLLCNDCVDNIFRVDVDYL